MTTEAILPDQIAGEAPCEYWGAIIIKWPGPPKHRVRS